MDVEARSRLKRRAQKFESRTTRIPPRPGGHRRLVLGSLVIRIEGRQLAPDTCAPRSLLDDEGAGA